MSGVEMIAAALAAGALAGVTGAASAAVEDAGRKLRDLLRLRLRGRLDSVRALESEETEAGVWETRLGPELSETGADQDQQILAAAARVLELTGHDRSMRVENNYGVAAVTMTGNVTINNRPEPLPPTPAGTV